MAQLKKIPVSKVPDSEASPAQKVWGLDWSQHFPKTLTASITVDRITAQEAWPLVDKLFPEVYQRDDTAQRFAENGGADPKKRYYEALGDFFVFEDQAQKNRVMGLAVGTLLDWSSYNFRNIAVHPDYQNLGLYPLFFDYLATVMKAHGVRRIEGDVAPSNQHHLHVLNKMGCVVSSLGYSERWGVLLHMTRYLHEADREQCARLFSMTASSDIAGTQRSDRKK
ncbi:MAG TPA: GNAT family N-acetyltransferase [Oligoflexus sp.]|uniref:GNAT family N-acetyltransferase n=1 Tax=Oligoflexus sp. TaxID=1971216 RepID=UPI002D7E9A8A|nr:GNAT family N-acetyltransferase [Oligoflexus sp.]HET9237171.1 GNAT family N-acetyltransferase [Oligoflexus sp.]